MLFIIPIPHGCKAKVLQKISDTFLHFFALCFEFSGIVLSCRRNLNVLPKMVQNNFINLKEKGEKS
jgi:hypothetical protein